MKIYRWVIHAGMATMLGGFGAGYSMAQEPAPAVPQAASSSNPQKQEQSKKQRYSHADDFLIIGTVFDAKGYAFPGVRLKLRRSSEKKFHWEDYTNSRGDFAVRVPQGLQYEMVVHAKGFADQMREVEAKPGLGEARLVFRMEPVGGKKK